MALNWIDLLLVILVLLGTLLGWRRGFFLEFFDLVTWVASVLLGIRYYQPAAAWLAQHTAWAAQWRAPLAFLAVFGLSLLILRLTGGALIRRLPIAAHQHVGNRLLGLLPGFAHGLINAIIAAALLMAMPMPLSIQTQARDSELNNRFAGYAEVAESALRPVFDDAIGATMNMLTIKPQSSEMVKLPFTVTETAPRPELEAQMLELVNQERAAAGLQPLQLDPALVPTARKHSTDMLARGYFSHYSPEGRSAFERMAADRVTFFVAGENLALAPTVKLAHRGLMNSPGHRANILRPQFGRVGIGIMDGGIRGIMVTQNFRN